MHSKKKNPKHFCADDKKVLKYVNYKMVVMLSLKVKFFFKH